MLNEFYKQKIQQVHIVGEYANLMVKDYQEALQYVQDYFQMDYKKFIAEGNVAFGVGQISSMDEEELQEIKVRLKPFMVSECGRHGITRVYFMLTNIMDESSDVIYYGEGSEEMGKIAFQQEPEDKCFHLKGVVSRKKQMIPAMMEAAQIMANDFN